MIASGYNGPVKGPRSPHLGYMVQPETKRCNCDLTQPCKESIHAEANAIAYAAKKGIALEDTTMYCTHSPCVKCAELIIQSGIREVIFVEHFRDAEGLQLLISNNIQARKYETTE